MYRSVVLVTKNKASTGYDTVYCVAMEAIRRPRKKIIQRKDQSIRFFFAPVPFTDVEDTAASDVSLGR